MKTLHNIQLFLIYGISIIDDQCLYHYFIRVLKQRHSNLLFLLYLFIEISPCQLFDYSEVQLVGKGQSKELLLPLFDLFKNNSFSKIQGYDELYCYYY